MKADQSFAVSKIQGDLIGIYSLESSKLSLRSTDQSWFDTSWEVDYFPSSLLLTGLELGHRNTQLRFGKIEEVPNLQAFEDQLIGDWHLYKIRRKRKVENLEGTRFMIQKDGQYHISQGETILEQGLARIDSRHRKMIFDRDQTKWRIWFYGNELRLSNDQEDIHYSLKSLEKTDATAAL